MTQYTYYTGNPQLAWDEVKLEYIFLERENYIVMRKVRPIIRLRKKAKSGGLHVSCLAFANNRTGADRGAAAAQCRWGVPAEVIAEELRERHNYTCTVSHLSLDNKLDVSWVPEPGRDRVSLAVLSVPLTMMVIFLERENYIVMRKVRPIIRLRKKAKSGGLHVSCLAFANNRTGADRGAAAAQCRWGVPAEVIAEELRERHNYTCTVSHLSLDNKLDVSWVPEPGRDRVSLAVLSVPLTMMV
ncbi:unnamed protein product, partial [Coregonus sp. 'balchen']